ncbi:MAG: tRNA pseudouridine(38-40) synthase TruA [Clostridiales bacterium]|nr:tRNA pseudouridine(38-40) synthase TruA [Clostridiales bacterium]
MDQVVKMIIEYDGTNFFGWQRQTKSRSVQGDIERVLNRIFKREISIDGAGRTDAGVHAYGQVATFKTAIPMPLENLKRALNNFLSEDIRILNLSFESEEFHARYSAKGKTYVYKVLNALDRDVFTSHYAYHYPYEIKEELMLEAISYLIGEHDFTSFMASGSSAQNPIRIIHDITLNKTGDNIELTYTGNGFLYKMVRIITGYLLEVGQGKILPQKTIELFENPTRKYTTKVAPAEGLYLKEVYYK